ncbi:MAG: hypothetical protein ACU84J_06265 [Gammaproteobacteria bacterium]
MTTQSLFRLTRAVLATAALTLTAGTASADAITSVIPLPFPTGSGVALTPSPAPAGIPGFGYTNAFYITDFKFGSYTAEGTDALLKLTANFTVYFKDEAGNATGSAKLPGDFVLRIKGAPATYNPLTSPLLGTFDAVVDLATFTGKTSSGADMVVRVDPNAKPLGKISVSAKVGLTGTFVFDTPTPFVVKGQYSVNGGAFVDVPNLTAVNQPVGFSPAS